MTHPTALALLLALLLAACNGASGSRCDDTGADLRPGAAQSGQPCGPPVGGGGPDAGEPFAACAPGLVCCAACGIPDCQPRCATPCTGSDCECGCPRGPFP